MNIRIEGLFGLILLALIVFLAWKFFGFVFGLFDMSIGRALSYVAVGAVCYFIGKES